MDLVFLGLDEQLQHLRRLEAHSSSLVLDQVDQRFLACWIYHDLSIEGWVFRDNELLRALEGREGTTWLEIQLLDKVRTMKRAIQFIQNEARSRGAVELDFIKNLHRQLRSKDDETAGRYRKEDADNRVYRHDLIPPSAISYRLRRLVAFAQEEAEFLHPIRAAAEIHRRLMEAFPFQSDNGLVARLAMNFWLLRHSYPPAVFPVHDRHRYFDTYLSANGVFQKLVVDSMHSWAEARIKSLECLASATSGLA